MRRPLALSHQAGKLKSVEETEGPLVSTDVADIAVIGAGAAGLAASIAAAESLKDNAAARIVVFDGAKTLGAKILVSGGGRCNVTHDLVTAADFFGNQPVIRNVLAAFQVRHTIEWFASMGVELKREVTGKLFPVTDKARTIVQALTDHARQSGVELCPDHRVSEVSATEPGFEIRHRHGIHKATRLILATGGRSLPKSGSDGFGYQLARCLGHAVTPTVPGLVPFILEENFFHASLSGLSQEVELKTVVEGRQVDRRTGSLLWTHFGISGPVVMDASRWWTLATERRQQVSLYANFLPGRSDEQVREWMTLQAADHPGHSLVRTMATVMPERFAAAICERFLCDPQKAMGQVPRTDRNRLHEALTRCRFPIIRDRGWNFAEVTAGGVPLEEINFRTMESKRTTGLYLVGEILDCDGRIGGYNFQWAWSTGFVAGRAAACGNAVSPPPREDLCS